MEITVLVDDTVESDKLPGLCAALTESQSRFNITVKRSPFETRLDENDEIDPQQNFTEFEKCEGFSLDKVYLLFSRARMKDNYFSHFVGNLYQFSCYSWEYYTTASLEAGALYAIVTTLLWNAQPKHRFHAETRGCVFDFVETKTDIDVGIRHGALCDECSRVFHANMKADDLSAVLDLLDIVAFFANTGRLPRRKRARADALEILPFVPRSTRHYNPTREEIAGLEKAYQILRSSREPDASSELKGQSLEAFSNRLFSCLDGFELYGSKLRLQDCEVDLSFKVNGSVSDLHRSLGSVVFIECKNRSRSAGVAQVSHHIMNLTERNLKAGIFVSTGGISGYDPSRRNIQDSLSKIISAYRQSGILVLPIVWEDIDAVRNGLNLYELLDQKRMEIIHQ